MIQVSFGKDELDLLDEIEKRCKYIKQSDWMKQAASEKIEREKQSTYYEQEQPQPINGIDNFLRNIK